MSEQQHPPELCIRCGRREIHISNPAFCAPCLYIVLERMAGPVVRRLITAMLRADNVSSLQQRVDESVDKYLVAIKSAMHEVFARRASIVTTVTEEEMAERFQKSRSEQEGTPKEQEESRQRRAGIEPEVLFTWDMLMLFAERRFWRRYLLRRFGYDTRRARQPSRTVPVETVYDQYMFDRALTNYAKTEAKYAAGLDALLKSREVRKGRRFAVTAAVEAMTKAESLNPLMGLMMDIDKTAPSLLREPAAIDTAAWADKRVKEYASREKGDVKNFIAAVRLGVESYLTSNPSVPLTTEKGINPVVESIGKELKRTVPIAEKLADLQNVEGVVELDALGASEQAKAEADFQMREEARIDLNKLAAHAGLSERERELFQYLTQYPDAEDADIAEYMNVALGTAKVTKHNMRKKLRRAATKK